MLDSKKVFISSTTSDLSEHRNQVLNACLRQGMFPQMMENMAANVDDVIAASLRMVDEADLYIGIFAHKYGYVPSGFDTSIIEIEYNRALERHIPCLIFLMDEQHSIKPSDVETGAGATRLKVFKDRLKSETVVHYFSSPEDLRTQVINALSQYRDRDLTSFHYVGIIPSPPTPYIAHPYTLLQMRNLVGRQGELNLLTDWVSNPSTAAYPARIFNMVAIGGMGKSAVTWKWFMDIAPHEMEPLAGRIWWSFYESDATCDNFIIRALAYVTGRTKEDIERNTKRGEREDQLLAILDREPLLIVLDGLERILIAYARMDANRIIDDNLDKDTGNIVSKMLGVPESASPSLIGKHRLRKTADPRAGNFLRKLAGVRASRILISTRLYPADLETATGDPLPGSFAYVLRGLSNADAVNLWRAFGVSGSRDELLRLFLTFENHPLLIQALASEIAHYRRAPGDLASWQSSHPTFDPLSLPLAQVKTNVLTFALRGVNENQKKVLQTVAAFRMPATYDTLAALLVGEDKIFLKENALDDALTELEDRGLLGWDKRANRYDMHPIVRGVVWNGLDKGTKQSIYGTLQSYFESMPPVDEHDVNSLADLAPAIELYNTLIGMERFDTAAEVFYERLNINTMHRLSVNRQRAELLEMLFPQGVDQLPTLESPKAQAATMNSLASAYDLSGQLGRAIPLYRRSVGVAEQTTNTTGLADSLSNLSFALFLTGKPREAEGAARRVLLLSQELEEVFYEGTSVLILGLILASRGALSDADMAFNRSLRLFALEDKQMQGVATSFLAQQALWVGDFASARDRAEIAWKLAEVSRYERDFIRAARIQGSAALSMGDMEGADEILHHALLRARTVSYVEEELNALIALARLRCRQDQINAARKMLDDVWEPAERGPYRISQTDAYNALSEIDHAAGDLQASIEAATNAYRLAWCDGPPFTYQWGLEAARAQLRTLGALEPSYLLPYDESRYEPMVEVEIDPPESPPESSEETDEESDQAE